MASAPRLHQRASLRKLSSSELTPFRAVEYWPIWSVVLFIFVDALVESFECSDSCRSCKKPICGNRGAMVWCGKEIRWIRMQGVTWVGDLTIAFVSIEFYKQLEWSYERRYEIGDGGNSRGSWVLRYLDSIVLFVLCQTEWGSKDLHNSHCWKLYVFVVWRKV